MARRYDLVIVGFGSGGMVAAELAAKLGLRVAVVERDRPGGDCLWTGCVPSKALIASARAAHVMRTADAVGLDPVEPEIDLARVFERIRSVQAEIASTDDDPGRFTAMGVEVVEGEATVVGPHEVAVGDRVLSTRRILLATGSRPRVPDLPGLVDAGFLSSENLFEQTTVPTSITVIGGGPIAVELAQALTRLGAAVTVVERAVTILARDEPSLVGRLEATLRAEGVTIHTGTRAGSVTVEDGRKVVHAVTPAGPCTFVADEIIVAAGRSPNVGTLGLAEVGVETDGRGVVVDDGLRSSVPSIYAVGDVAGREHFTHAAAYQAALAVRNMFLPGRSLLRSTIPWTTFTDPELAHAGLTSDEARAEHGDKVRVWERSLDSSDRARADARTEGSVVLVSHRGRIVGGHVLGPSAGEVIHDVLWAIEKRMSVTRFASLVRVYPTHSTPLGLAAAESGYELAHRFRWLARLARFGP